MQQKKRVHPKIKSSLHPRSKHRERYDFDALIKESPELNDFVKPNKYGDDSIDFADPQAVKKLNTAILKHFYDIRFWEIPEGYLCPPIPGRADSIHYLADLLSASNGGNIPQGNNIRCLDIGVGASCIYPILGNKLYGWSFVGSEIDERALAAAQQTIEQNNGLDKSIELRFQNVSGDLFNGILKKDEQFELSICNPPFHASAEEAQAGTMRKIKNLHKTKVNKPTLNFGGQNNELWCKGGERLFVRNMINQSKRYAQSCLWFSTLVSKESNLDGIYAALKNVNATTVTTIPMGQGNKISRIVAWTFLNEQEHEEWFK